MSLIVGAILTPSLWAGIMAATRPGFSPEGAADALVGSARAAIISTSKMVTSPPQRQANKTEKAINRFAIKSATFRPTIRSGSNLASSGRCFLQTIDRSEQDQHRS